MSGPDENYLYVFGLDAQSTPYFGVVQLKLAPPFDENAAAASLNVMEVCGSHQVYSRHLIRLLYVNLAWLSSSARFYVTLSSAPRKTSLSIAAPCSVDRLP